MASDPEGSEFELESPVERELSARTLACRVSAASYLRKYQDYVDELVSAGMEAGDDAVRKIKRWVKTGREREPMDLPPLDELPQMAGWWRRNMKHKVPDYLLKLESSAGLAGAGANGPTSDRSKKSGKEAMPQEEALPPMQIVMGGAYESDEGLHQARALVKATFDQLQLAIRENRSQQAATLRREWQQFVNTLRQWEKDMIKIQEGKGEVLRTREVNTEMVSIFGVISMSFMNALIELAQKLDPDTPPLERRAMVMPLRDKVFSHLKKTRFAQAYQLAQQMEGGSDAA